MPILYTILFKLLMPIFSLVSGAFLIFKPEEAIKLQQRFYARINWRMEPISLILELRNTRIMGGILIIMGVLLLYIR